MSRLATPLQERMVLVSRRLFALALLVLAPTATAAEAGATAQAWLEAPTRQAYEGLPEGSVDAARLGDALAEGAYPAAWALIGEARGHLLAAEAWEDAQTHAEPHTAYRENLTAQAETFADHLSAVAQRLAAQTGSRIDTARAERLLLAANLLAESEMEQMRAVLTLQAAQPGNPLASEGARYTLARGIAVASVLADMADHVLGLPDGPRSGRILLVGELDSLVTGRGGTQQAWFASEGGPLHRLARHLQEFQAAFLQDTGNANGDQVSADVVQLRETSVGLRGLGLAGVRPTILAAQAQWWLGQMPEGGDASWAPLLGFLHASAGTVPYEAGLLQSSLADPPVAWMLWMTWGLVTIVLAGAGTWAWRRARSRRRPRTGLLSHLMLVLLATAALVPGAGAQADQGPILLSNGTAHAMQPQFAFTADGKMAFLWTECMGPEVAGCPAIRYRTHDPAARTWSEAQTLRQAGTPGQQAFQPRLLAIGGGLRAFWLEGGDYEDGKPVVLWSCRVQQASCTEASALSDPGLQAANPVVALGSDGRVRVAWQEEYVLAADADGARILFREQGPSGSWGPSVSFLSGSKVQREPAIAVDESGRAHVAWREVPAKDTGGGWAYQIVMHSWVEPGAAVSERPIPLSHVAAARGMAALAADGPVLHAVYTTDHDVFHRSRTVDGNWSKPTNLSNTNRRLGALWPELQVADGGKLLASWVSGGLGNFLHSAVQGQGGVWGTSFPLLEEAPYNGMLLHPVLRLAPDGALHEAWAGTGPSTPEGRVQAFYRLHPPRAVAPSAAPTLGVKAPATGGWTLDDPVVLRVEVASESGVGPQTRWSVDGQQVPFQVTPGRTIEASVAGLSEGLHEATLAFYDGAGKQAQVTWRFGVDRTAPAAPVRAGGDATQGWSAAPVSVWGAVQQDGGAPVRLQAQLDQGVWEDLEAPLALPEGQPFTTRLRAVDAAGNVALGEPLTMGWDATAPAREFDVPEWLGGTAFRVVFRPLDATAPDPEAQGHDYGHDHATHDHTPAGGEAAPPAGPGAPVSIAGLLRQLDSPRESRQQATGDVGELVFDGLAEGLYELAIEVRDGAGNIQDPPPGTWRLGIDLTPPTFAVDDREGARLVRVSESLSGLSALRLTTAAGLLHESKNLNGTRQAEVPVPATAKGWIEIEAVDQAGNAAVLRFDAATGAILVRPAAQFGNDLGADPDADGIPLPPAVPLLSLLFALLTARAAPGRRQ